MARLTSHPKARNVLSMGKFLSVPTLDFAREVACDPVDPCTRMFFNELTQLIVSKILSVVALEFPREVACDSQECSTTDEPI